MILTGKIISLLCAVRRKAGSSSFPLQPDVATALTNYIKNVRPHSSSKHLFLSFHPPFGPMHPSSINEIVSLRLKQLNIRPKKRGPHALRHACATELLRQGTYPKDIADFLGHRTCQSVGVYAKFSMQVCSLCGPFQTSTSPENYEPL
jgi:integrase/recombinase XerD